MSQSSAIEIGDNLLALDGKVSCVQCQAHVGSSALAGDYLSEAIIRERPTTTLGDALIRAAPQHFTDRKVMVRQAFCPGCKTLLLTETLLSDEQFRRVRRLDEGSEEGR